MSAPLVLHFTEDTDTSGYFRALATLHDRLRFPMLFGTLRPIDGALRQFMSDAGVDCLSLDARSRAAYPAALLRLARILRLRRVHIIHTHLFDPSVIGLLSAALARTPIRVMTRHYSDYHTRIDKRWHMRLDQLCTRVSDRVIAVSRHTADHMIEKEGAPPEKLRVVLNGLDPARVNVSGPDARERIRREFGIDDAYLLLVAARLHPEKGYEHLFRAMAVLRGRLSRPVLLLVAGHGDLLPHYTQMARDVGIDDLVRFVGFRSDVPDLMTAADLVVLPSVAEAFGLVLTEALLLGTPVVATRVGGIPEIVDDGRDGLLVPPGDGDALAAALVSLLEDPARRARMAGAGREKIRQRFAFADMVRAYENVYRELLAEHPRAVGAPSSVTS